MQVRVFAILVLIFGSAFAGTAQQKSTVTNSRKIDSLLQPIPNNRQLFHLKIDDELNRIDYLDGKYDNKVENYRGQEADQMMHNDILRHAKAIAHKIENTTYSQEAGVNNNTKIRYLRAVETDCRLFFEDAYDGSVQVSYYRDMFDGLEGIIEAIQKNTLKQYVQQNANMSTYLNRGLIEDDAPMLNLLIDSMCYKYPDMMEKQLASIANTNGACAVMAYMAKKSINRVMTAATSTNYERDIVRRCDDPLVKAINNIATQTNKDEQFNALLFIGELMNGRMTIAQVKDIVSTPDKYYTALVKLRLENTESSKYVTDKKLQEQALIFVREINALHDENNPKIRYKCIDNFSARELYYLAVLCTNEIYTSSFVKGVFARLVTKMQPLNGDDFLSTVNRDKFRTFLRMCANYNTLDTFLHTMPIERSNQLMNEFVVGLGDKQPVNIEGAVDVADAFGSINNAPLIALLQNTVRGEYEKNYLNNNKEGLIVYFILYSLFTSKDEGSDDSLFNHIMSNQLHLKPINTMPFNSLVSENSGKVYEQVFFYGDKDGKSSYSNFLGFIKKINNFKIDESNEWFTRITAINSKVPFEIYANKPLDEEKELDEKAQIALDNYLTENDIHPSILVHRGHSYHLKSTIERICQDNKVVILGSCGGYQNLNTILQHSPDAQIVSSKQVGSMNITDPILREVNTSVMNGQEVNWVKIWTLLDMQIKTPDQRDLFNDYVPPHHNLGALFIKAYKTLNEVKL